MLLVCVDSKCTGGWTRLRFLPTTDRTNPEPALKNWCVTVDHTASTLITVGGKGCSRSFSLLESSFWLASWLIRLIFTRRPSFGYKKPNEHLQRSKNVIASLKVILQLGLKRVLLPLFNQGGSGAGSEPVPYLEAVLWVTATKEPGELGPRAPPTLCWSRTQNSIRHVTKTTDDCYQKKNKKTDVV